MNISGPAHENRPSSLHRLPCHWECGKCCRGCAEGERGPKIYHPTKNPRLARRRFGSTEPLWNGCGYCMGTYCPSSSCHFCAKSFFTMSLSPPQSLPTSYRTLRNKSLENSLRPSAAKVGLITRSVSKLSLTPSLSTFCSVFTVMTCKHRI